MFHVKPVSPTEDEIIAALMEPLGVAGIETSPNQRSLLARHARMVLEANSTMNLTAIVQLDRVVELHIVDSLAFLRHVGVLEGEVVDIGSGAGYPGIPLAIMGLSVTMCESVRKKADFLERCVRELPVTARVRPVRAEELAVEEPGLAEYVIARAVSALPSLVELSAPLLRIGGCLIALKGRPDQSEIAAGREAAAICGLRQCGIAEYALPAGEARTVVTYERTDDPRVRLPRRPGMAQRSPLGGVPVPKR